jgi:hypothetical protein
LEGPAAVGETELSMPRLRDLGSPDSRVEPKPPPRPPANRRGARNEREWVT